MGDFLQTHAAYNFSASLAGTRLQKLFEASLDVGPCSPHDKRKDFQNISQCSDFFEQSDFFSRTFHVTSGDSQLRSNKFSLLRGDTGASPPYGVFTDVRPNFYGGMVV